MILRIEPFCTPGICAGFHKGKPAIRGWTRLIARCIYQGVPHCKLAYGPESKGAAGAHLIRNGKLGSRYRVHEKGRGIGIPTAIFTNYFNLVYTRWDRNFQYRLVTEVTGYDQVVHFASDIISAGSRTVWKYQSKQSRIRIVTFFRNPMNYVFKLSGRISI